MFSISTPSPNRRFIISLAAGIAVLCLLVVTTMGALADTVNISDKAGVLNVAMVQSEASTLPYPINIYTINTFTGTKSQFDQEAINTINNAHNPRLIVIAIDTKAKHLAIVGGKDVSTSNSVYTNAVNAFRANFNNGDYTAATLAAIRTLRSELSGASTNPGGGSSNGSNQPVNGTGLNLTVLLLLILGVIVVVAIGLFVAVRVRRGFMGPRPMGPMGPPYQQPYNQGYPPNFYGPGYNQGPGVNPLVAGGLGAAAGGLLGYELGKEQGEQEAGEQSQGANAGGGDFGGGAGGDFGGGGGGGGDFGSGAGGDFGGGGGGDFGGGGGGGDFGGGGG